MKILDANGQEIGRIPVDLDAGEESLPITLQVYPAPGAVFKSGSSTKIKAMARLHNTSDSYVDLAAGIDVSGYPEGAPVEFDVKFVAHASNIVGRIYVVLPIVVARSLQAGYLA